MKKIVQYTSLFTILICFGCPAAQESYPVKEITYEAMTRGRSEMIHIKSNLMTYKTHKKSKEVRLSNKQLKALYKAIKAVNYSEVETLKAPSGKRLYDGAMAAVVIFKTETETYQSASFDDDNPPNELKELVALLKSFVQ